MARLFPATLTEPGERIPNSIDRSTDTCGHPVDAKLLRPAASLFVLIQI